MKQVPLGLPEASPPPPRDLVLPELVIAVDPGNDSGIAVVTVGRRPALVAHTCWRGIEKTPIDSALRGKRISDWTLGRPVLFAVESMPTTQWKHQKAVFAFVASRTRWKDSALVVPNVVAVEDLHLATWRSRAGMQTLARTLPRKTKKRPDGSMFYGLDWKRAARAWVEIHHGVVVTNDNTAEAIVMATGLAIHVASGGWQREQEHRRRQREAHARPRRRGRGPGGGPP